MKSMVCFAALFSVFVAGALTISAQEPGGTPQGASVLALKGLDPVALVNGKEIPGEKNNALERGGFRYLFASDESRKQFTRDPARYQIQRNGDCAAMPGVRGNPELFAVVKGRIYIFGSQHVGIPSPPSLRNSPPTARTWPSSCTRT